MKPTIAVIPMIIPPIAVNYHAKIIINIHLRTNYT